MRKSDTALMERWIGARDPEAFAQLVDRHAGMVLAACRRVLGNHADAEETAQECFLQVSQAQRAVAPSLGGWLHRLATNRALDRLRSDTARSARERNYAAEQFRPSEPTWNDIQPHVDAIIAQLPDELQAPLVLHFFEGQTHREVARALGIGRSTVTERIQRAIGEIREQLAAKDITLGIAALAGLFGALEVAAAPPTFVASLKKIGIATGRPVVALRFPLKWRAAVVLGGIVVLVAALWVSNTRANARNERDASTLIATDVPAGGEGPVGVSEEVAEVITPVAEAPDISLARGDVIEAATPEAEKPEMLRLRCVDEEGKPVAGAEVYYMWTDGSTPPMLQADRPGDIVRQPFGPARSNGNGYVEVPATHKATPTSNGYASAYARVPGRLVGLWQHWPRSREITGWDSIVMVPSTRIGGVVTVPEGFDVTKVRVRVLTLRITLGDFRFDESMAISSKYSPPLWPRLFETSPSRDGVYGLGDIPSGNTCYLEFTAPGLGEVQRYNFKTDEGEAVDVELFPEASISGTVRHATGEPAVNVPVFARPSRARDSSLGVVSAFQARTDAQGRYTIKGLPEATYAVLVQHYGEPPSEITLVLPTLKVFRGDHQEGIDFNMEQGALQEGTLIDRESGVPIVGARLIAMNSGAYELSDDDAIGSALTDRYGKFTFRLPVGASHVYIFDVPKDYLYPDEQGRTSIQVTPDQSALQPLTLYLTRKSEAEKVPIDKATIEGRVVDEEGRPVAGVPVNVNQKTRKGARLPMQSEARPTGDDGRFSVSVLSVAEHQIIAGGGGVSSRVESEWVALQAGETRSMSDLRVAPYDQVVAVILTGFIDDPEANPPHVSAKNRETLEDLTSGFADENGRVDLYVPDVPLLVTISQEGCNVVQVAADPGTEIGITLEPEEKAAEEQDLLPPTRETRG